MQNRENGAQQNDDPEDDESCDQHDRAMYRTWVSKPCSEYTTQVHKHRIALQKRKQIQWRMIKAPNPATPTSFLETAITAGPDMGNETPFRRSSPLSPPPRLHPPCAVKEAEGIVAEGAKYRCNWGQ